MEPGDKRDARLVCGTLGPRILSTPERCGYISYRGHVQWKLRPLWIASAASVTKDDSVSVRNRMTCPIPSGSVMRLSGYRFIHSESCPTAHHLAENARTMTRTSRESGFVLRPNRKFDLFPSGARTGHLPTADSMTSSAPASGDGVTVTPSALAVFRPGLAGVSPEH